MVQNDSRPSEGIAVFKVVIAGEFFSWRCLFVIYGMFYTSRPTLQFTLLGDGRVPSDVIAKSNDIH